MDQEGYLPLNLIASFPRVRALTGGQDFIIESLRQSEKIELSDDEQKV
jgi:la-related protein 1